MYSKLTNSGNLLHTLHTNTQLPYYDWELLETDADQCNFLANRLFHPSLGQDTTCTS